MKPQSAALFEEAQSLLGEAETMLEVDLNGAAGRRAISPGSMRRRPFYSRHMGAHSRCIWACAVSLRARLVKDDASVDHGLLLSLAIPTNSKRLPTTNPAPV